MSLQPKRKKKRKKGLRKILGHIGSVVNDVRFGSGRLWDPAWYAASYGVAVTAPRQVRSHYRATGHRLGYDPNPLFDTNWYLGEHPEAVDYPSPLDHYHRYGFKRKLVNPNPFFNGRWYLKRNPDAQSAGVNPLLHYLAVGAAQHRAPSPYFDSRWYTERYVDRIAPGALPLAHYLREGAYQGLAPRAELLDGRTGLASAWYQDQVKQTYARMISPAQKAAPLERGGFWAPELRNRGGKPLAVYTAIFGDYDTLKLPHPDWAASADFYCITDRTFREAGIWQVVRPDYHNAEPTRIARFYKIHPHLYFTGYEATLWIDGNIVLRADPADLLRDLPPDRDMTAFHHPSRTRWQDEVMICCDLLKDDAGVLLTQASRYCEAGYQQNAPLIESNVILRHHNRPQVISLMNRWWAEIERGSRRDQISLTYCLDQVPDMKLGFFSEASGRDSTRVSLVSHGRAK